LRAAELWRDAIMPAKVIFVVDEVFYLIPRFYIQLLKNIFSGKKKSNNMEKVCNFFMGLIGGLWW